MTAIEHARQRDNGQDASVVVGLITCRNPSGLAKSLAYLAGQETRFTYRIIVVDNDQGLAGKKVVERYATSEGSTPVQYVVEAEAGIPFARNRLVAAFLETGADFLVMYDDDEYPAPSWLERMVDTSLATGADVVGGAVEAVLESPAVEPIRASDYDKKGGKTIPGGALVESTANLLVTRRVFEAIQGEWFRRAFARTGGSDTDFLRRTAQLGFRHALAPEALVYEDIPASRITAAWWEKRAFRSGGGLVVARRMNYGILRTFAFETTSIAYLITAGLARFLTARSGSRRKHEAALMIARARGKIAAMLGRRYEEYSQANYR